MVNNTETTNKGLEKAQLRYEQAKQKLEVHNPVVVNGAKEQKLTVYYKFVGQID